MLTYLAKYLKINGKVCLDTLPFIFRYLKGIFLTFLPALSAHRRGDFLAQAIETVVIYLFCR